MAIEGGSPLGRTPGEGKQVCVTGAGGFLAGWVVKCLLERGYRVRGTVRDALNADTNAHLWDLARAHSGMLELVSADLQGPPEAFEAAVAGCEYVCHMAAPRATASPKSPLKEVVEPAVLGTESVFKAILSAKCARRVVMTSSVAAIRGDSDAINHTFTEEDWNVSSTLDDAPYQLAKTLSERAAWRAYGSQFSRSPSRVTGAPPPVVRSEPSRMLLRSRSTSARGLSSSPHTPRNVRTPRTPQVAPEGPAREAGPGAGLGLGAGAGGAGAAVGALLRAPSKKDYGNFFKDTSPPTFELVCINPGVVLGPVLAKRHAKSSPHLVLDLLKSSKACPQFHFPVVDVRDVAWAHVAALENPAACGRYQLVSQDLWLIDIADILRPEFPPPFFSVPKRVMFNWQVKAQAMFKKRRASAAAAAANAGKERHHSSAKAEKELGLKFLSVQDTILDTAKSLVELELVV